MLDIHIVNGPNLNLVGIREPHIYGHETLQDHFQTLTAQFQDRVQLYYFQSNHEGHLIDYLQEIGFTPVGIVLNAGALTHTSIAIGDTLAAITAPVVEVHISNIYEREKFRHHSYIKPHAIHHIVGKGLHGYTLAIESLIGHIK